MAQQLTSSERRVIKASKEIQAEAKARGSGFTRSEFQKRLGKKVGAMGGTATAVLRSGKRKQSQQFKETGEQSRTPQPTPQEEQAKQSLVGRGRTTRAEEQARQSLIDRGRSTREEFIARQSLIDRGRSRTQQLPSVRVDPTPRRKEDQFSSQLNANIRPSRTGLGSTGIITPLSRQQRERIDRGSGNVLTVRRSELERKSTTFRKEERKLFNIQNKIKELSKGKIDPKTNGFLGTDEELLKIQKEQAKFDRQILKLESLGGKVTSERIVAPTIGAGVLGFTRQVPTTDFNVGSDVFQLVSSGSRAVTRTLGGTTQGFLETIGFKGVRTPSRQDTIIEPQFGSVQRDVRGNIITGQKEVTIPEGRILTPKQIRQGVEVGADVGKFFIPVVGAGLFATETLASAGEVGFSPTRFIREKPLEALAVGLVGGAVVVRGARAIRKPLLTFEKIDVVGKEAPTLVGKPSMVVVGQGRQATFFPNIFLAEERVQRAVGQKTIVTTPTRKFMNLFVDVPPVFKGSAKLDPKGFKKAIKLLKKQGLTEKEAREILRERKAKITRDIFQGQAVVVEDESSAIIKIFGQETSKPIVKTINGIKTSGGESKINFLNLVGKPTGTKGELELSRFSESAEKAFLTATGKPFTKLSQKGKTIETREIFLGSKKLKEVEIPIRRVTDDIFESSSFDVIGQVGISRRTLPRKITSETSRGIVLAQKGQADVIINLDELLGLPTQGIRRIKTGGKKSSPEFLEQLFSQEATSQKLASALSKVKTIPKKIIRQPSSVAQPQVSQTQFPLIVGGSGVVTVSRTGQQSVVELPAIDQGSIFSLGLTISDQRTQNLSIPIVNERLSARVDTRQLQPLVTDLSQRSPLREETLNANFLALRLGQRSSALAREDVRQQARQLQVPLQTQSTKQALEIIQRPTQILRPTTGTPQIPRPRTFLIPPLLPPIGEPVQVETGEATKKIMNLFKVFVKKQKKDVLLAKAKTKEEAFRLLKEELRGTLRASGFVKTKGKKVRPNLAFGSEFRLGKEDPFRVVQRKTRRLSATPETKEIQFFRKTKRRRSFFS